MELRISSCMLRGSSEMYSSTPLESVVVEEEEWKFGADSWIISGSWKPGRRRRFRIVLGGGGGGIGGPGMGPVGGPGMATGLSSISGDSMEIGEVIRRGKADPGLLLLPSINVTAGRETGTVVTSLSSKYC